MTYQEIKPETLGLVPQLPDWWDDQARMFVIRTDIVIVHPDRRAQVLKCDSNQFVEIPKQ